MSTQRTHETELATPVVIMTCDVAGCLRQVRRAPRIIIPSRTPAVIGHRPIRVMTTLHYCEFHARVFDAREWLTDANKRRVELAARLKRMPDFVPDFEAVRVEPVLVTTPEYLAFMRDILGSNIHVVA